MTTYPMTTAYRLDAPAVCAASHRKWADHLDEEGISPGQALAHRLADAIICDRTGSTEVSDAIERLADTPLPPSPPGFSEVVRRVERVEGMTFGALFSTLPGNSAGGDAIISAIWQRVTETRQARATCPTHEVSTELIETLPESVRAALAHEGATTGPALEAALGTLSEEDARSVGDQLTEAGIIGGVSEKSRKQFLARFEPFLQGVAQVARGQMEQLDELEMLLPQIEMAGWMIEDAIRHIWEGERCVETLTEDIDPNSAMLVLRLLEILRSEESEEGTDSEKSNTKSGAFEDIDIDMEIDLTSEETNVGGIFGHGAEAKEDRRSEEEQRSAETTGTAAEARSEPEASSSEEARLDEATRSEEEVNEEARRAVLEKLPVPIREAFELTGEAFGEALGRALEALPAIEARDILTELGEAGLIEGFEEIGPEQMLAHIDPLLFDIAQVAKGDESLRPMVESYLPKVEQAGMLIREPVFRIWAGERDETLLTEDLDEVNSFLIRRILVLIDQEVA